MYGGFSLVKIAGVIPIRYDSKRFPGKALSDLWGKSILQHVFERVTESKIFNKVIIATCDEKIKDAAETINAAVVMTSKDCSTGSDRAAEIAANIDCEIIVNIQGDQPILPNGLLEKVVNPLINEPDLQVVTPIYPITDIDIINNPNVVKVIVDKDEFAIYFSRLPIPYVRNRISNVNVFYKHIGVYAYRKDFLLKYTKFSKRDLERTEGLEQLRILENGYKIKTVIAADDSKSIDTKEDLKKIESMKK